MFLFFLNAVVLIAKHLTFICLHIAQQEIANYFILIFFFRKKSARIKERKQKVKRKSEKSQSHLKRFVDYYVTVVEETCSESRQTSRMKTMVL